MSTAVWTTAKAIVMVAPCIWLMLLPFKNRLRIPYTTVSVIAAGLLAFCAITGIYLHSSHNPFQNWLLGYSIVLMGVYVILGLLVIDAPVGQVLFSLFIIKSYSDDAMLFTELLNGCFLPPEQYGYFKNSFVITLAVITAVTYPFMVLFMVKLLRPVIDRSTQSAFWRYLWLVPAAFYVIYRLGIDGKYLSAEIDWKFGNYLLPCFWAVCTFLFYFLVLKMLTETSRTMRLEEALRVSEIQMVMQELQYEEQNRGIEETHKARLGLRRSLLELEQYAKMGDSEGAQRYLQQYIRVVDQEEPPLCLNHAVNSIVRYYGGNARGLGAKVSVRLELPDELPIPENEFCILLGNLLENAMDACARQTAGDRFLHLQAGTAGDRMLVVTVKNSYSGEVRCREGHYLSSKRNSEGIGITSVRHIAQKYNGVAKFEFGEGIFNASVLLNPS